MTRKKSKDDLLTFDEDSPLFVKKKKIKKKSKKKTSSKKTVKQEILLDVEIEFNDDIFLEKPKAKKRRKKRSSFLDLPKYKINSPKDCKHIHKNFKKILDEKWELLDIGTLKEAADVPSYLRGVASVIKDSRPSEYKEILSLIIAAKKAVEKRNRSGY